MRNSVIAAKVLTELNRQLNQELAAAHAYRALSSWCEDQNLKGFASYFSKQVAEEAEHAGLRGHVEELRSHGQHEVRPCPDRSSRVGRAAVRIVL